MTRKQPARAPRRTARRAAVDWRALERAARAVLARAYAPYSGLHVAAALVDARGRIATGVNVENASYGLTSCAERNALYAARAQGSAELAALVLVSSAGLPITPCGACRQVLHELAPGLRLRSVGHDGHVLHATIAELLPLAFDARSWAHGRRAARATRSRR